MKLTVTIIDGFLAGRSFDLESGFLTVGRGENCTIRFDPQRERIASKQHAFIEARSDGFYLTDNNSTNGTLLNGERLSSTVKLSPSDIIQFGRNGATAGVEISSENRDRSIEEFRDFQSAQFNRALAERPVTIQSSISGLGLTGAGTKRSGPKRGGLYIAIGLLIFILPILLAVVALLMFASVGVGPAIVASAIAFAPAVIYLVPLIWLDRYDPEPLWLLALAFLWGALVSVIVSFVVNTSFLVLVFSVTENKGVADLASAVLSAPIIEEASKGVGLLILLIFFRRYFDDILDGIVYGGIIALGFATVENVLYYGRGLNDSYEQYGATSSAVLSFLVLFSIRGIFSPFAHVTFTSLTGIGCGIARESHNKLVRLLMPVLGYASAVLLHMVWNGMAVAILLMLDRYEALERCEDVGLGGANLGLCGFFGGYILLQIPFFLIWVGFTIFIMRRQRRILNEMLALDIARGLIPSDHAAVATSAFRSSRWLLGGLFTGKYGARSQYIRSIGKLGLSYWHIQRATAAHGQTASFEQNPVLREEVLKWRDKV